MFKLVYDLIGDVVHSVYLDIKWGYIRDIPSSILFQWNIRGWRNFDYSEYDINYRAE